MVPKFFVHKCPTIDFRRLVNHFRCPEILGIGGFSAESYLVQTVPYGVTDTCKLVGALGGDWYA
jgi:hypothetical protein